MDDRTTLLEPKNPELCDLIDCMISKKVLLDNPPYLKQKKTLLMYMETTWAGEGEISWLRLVTGEVLRYDMPWFYGYKGFWKNKYHHSEPTFQIPIRSGICLQLLGDT